MEKLKNMRRQVQRFDEKGKFQLKILIDLARNTTINRNNQILLNKLVEISCGKWSSVVMAPKRVRAMMRQNRSMSKNGSLTHFGSQSQMSAFPGKAGSVGPKSMNIGVRRLENDRIEREN